MNKDYVVKSAGLLLGEFGGRKCLPVLLGSADISTMLELPPLGRKDYRSRRILLICVRQSRPAHWNVNKLARQGNMDIDVMDEFRPHFVLSQYERDLGADYKESVQPGTGTDNPFPQPERVCTKNKLFTVCGFPNPKKQCIRHRRIVHCNIFRCLGLPLSPALVVRLLAPHICPG